MRRSILVLAVLAVLATSCGGDESPSAITEAEQATTTTSAVDVGFPVTIEAANGTVTIEQRPERIVSISPTATEVLFAIGAGDQVVAVDGLSDHPAEAPVTELSAFTPSVEAIAAYDPDLVFLSFDPNQDVIPGLGALGIPVILHGTALGLDDAFLQWEQTGIATGHAPEASALVSETREYLAAAYASVPEAASGLTYYYELDDTYYSLTSSSFVGELIAPTGLVNIADTEDVEGFGFPQLTAEYIVGSDPALILLADVACCGQSAQTVAERPGWDAMTAVSRGHVVELDDDIASRWGPRIVDLVDAVVTAILELEPVDE